MLINDNAVLGINNAEIRSRGSVDASADDPIAPVGTSGGSNGVAAHLHLGFRLAANEPRDNPLFHLIHTPDNLPTFTIESPPNNHEFTKEELKSNYPIKVDVNSTGGPDVNQVTFYVLKDNDPAQIVYLPDASGEPTFSFTGMVGEYDTAWNSIVESDGNTTGVQPHQELNQYGQLDSLGHDRFIYLQNFGALNLPDGEHTLVAKITDVNGNSVSDLTHRFKIPVEPPIILSTTPSNGDQEAPVSGSIAINFSKEMNTTTVQSAVSIFPSVSGTYSWTNGNKTVVFKPSSMLEEDTNYTVTVSDSAKDASGNQLDGDKDGNAGGNYTFTFHTVADPPVVSSTSPSNNATGVDLKSNIVITFDREMNVSTTQAAIGIDPALSGPNYAWSNGNRTVTISHSQLLYANQKYTITISDAATSARGTRLDGDKDGRPGGNYAFTFTTIPPNIEILGIDSDYYDGSRYWVREGGKRVYIQLTDKNGMPAPCLKAPGIKWVSEKGTEQTVSFPASGNANGIWTGTTAIPGGTDGSARFKSTDGSSLKGVTSFMIDTIPPKTDVISHDHNWCWCPYGPVGVEVQVKEEGSGLRDVVPLGLGLYAYGCERPGSHLYGASLITDNVGHSVKRTGSLVVYESPCSSPDDNASPIINNSVGAVAPGDYGIAGKRAAILGSGYAYTALRFLRQQVKIDPEVLYPPEFTPDMYEKYPLLIIPTGGLRGLVQSEDFKARLASYVERGGAILALTQSQSYEYDALPGGGVRGYGYSNDQQCFTNAAYIETWHQIFSGMDRTSLDLNLDGFITTLPEGGQSYLRRMSNGQTALAMYQYGGGHVIATNLYTDWGYSVYQYTRQEVALIRDMIAWAMRPADLPEARPGETVTASMIASNTTNTDAATVKVVIRDPSKNTVKELLSPAAMPAGGSVELTIPHDLSATAPLGIWWVYYSLLDANGAVIQAEQEGARFAVSTRPRTPAQQTGITFTVASAAEYFLVGGSAEFTIMAFNAGDADRTVIAKYEGLSKSMTVPAGGSSEIGYTKALSSTGTGGRSITVKFYDEQGTLIGSAAKQYWVSQPSAGVVVQTDRPHYAKGDTVAIKATVNNSVHGAWAPESRIYVKKTLNNSSVIVHQDVRTISLSADATVEVISPYALPADADPVQYFVSAEIWDGTRQVSSSSYRFEVSRSKIAVKPVLPAPITTGVNAFSFLVSNTGTINVTSGVIEIGLSDPEGGTVYSGNAPFALNAGRSAILEIPIDIPSLKFGEYVLTYRQSDETGTGKANTVKASNQSAISVSWNKAYYKIRETANLALNLTNTGSFNQDNMTVTVSVPDTGYYDSRTVTLGVNNSASFNHTITIPDTVTAGQHDVNIMLTLQSGNTFLQTAKLVVPESSLGAEYLGSATVTAGDTIRLAIINNGGVDTSYTTEKLLLRDIRGVEIDLGNISGAIMAGEIKTVDLLTPAQTVSGNVILASTMKDSRTGTRTTYYKQLAVNGITAGLSAKTDKDIYSSTEIITALTTVMTGETAIENASMTIKVKRYKKHVGGEFELFLPKVAGWASFYSPQGVAVGSNGYMYVADTRNHRIQQFDDNGNFVMIWGRYGSGDGQFFYPRGIAVGPDGSVYVVDTSNHRIQKFDSTGNFILKWGSYGSGDGQFNNPKSVAISTDGSVFVTDTGNARIQKFDSSGNFIAKWGSYGKGDGQFWSACDIAVNTEGYVYVSESSNHRIQKFDSNGNFIMKWGSYGSGNGQFYIPYGIATSSEGYVYVADGYNNRIQKFDSSGNFITKWGAYGNGDGRFWQPQGVSVGPDGQVYVADTGNWCIQKFSGDGNFVSSWRKSGSGDGHFRFPYGVSVGPDGSIYVADCENNRIQKFDSTGIFITKWGSYGSGDGQVNYPKGVAVGPDGTVYVVDTYNNRIQKFDSTGIIITKWGSYGSGNGQFNSPYGVAVGSDGTVYVVDTYNNRIQKFDSAGNFITKWGSAGSGNGQLRGPRGITVGLDGSVFVADSNNNRIQKFDGNGKFITKWGSYGSGNGQFSYPTDVAVSPDGFVYAVDSYNDRIQMFTGSGYFMKKWGIEGDEKGMFLEPFGITISKDGHVYVVDSGNNRVQKMNTFSGGSETLYEIAVPLTQLDNITREFLTAIGLLNTTGKFYLEATLKNDLGQLISESEYPFLVTDSNAVVSLSTDQQMYKPSQEMNITGTVKNMSSVTLTNVKLEIKSRRGEDATQTIYTKIIDNVPPDSQYSFFMTINSGAEGIYSLMASISQNDVVLAEVADQYETVAPNLSATITAPTVVGNDPFTLVLEIKNNRKIATTVNVWSTADYQTKSLIMPALETRLIEYQQLITSDKSYTFTLSGDVTQTITKTVGYGLAASIQFGVQGSEFGVMPEGKVAVPVTISNTGQMDESLEVAFELREAGGGRSEERRSYFIPKGGSVNDTLYYDLTEGSYQITASSQGPVAGSQANITVLKENKVDMTLAVGGQGAGDGTVPVTVNVTNQGYNEINGSVGVSVSGSEGAVVWSAEQAVSQLLPQTSNLSTFSINTSAIAPGTYTVKAELLNNSGIQLIARSSSLMVRGATIELTQVPQYQTINAGAEASFAFKVKNTGNQEGPVDLNFKAYDLIDSTRTEWLKPGEEKEIAFAFQTPDDLEEKDYFASYRLQREASGLRGEEGQVKYHIAGINIGVTANLDKQYYSVGETARLTLNVSDLRPLTSDLQLFARVNYNGYEEQRPFTLTSASTLTFDISLSQITGEKLFYGIYHSGGRSIHLNSVYINKAGEITITTDKQVYNPGETVVVGIGDQGAGTGGQMTLTGPGGYIETFEFTGSATKTIALPEVMTAGTYPITAQLRTPNSELRTASHPIDVNGIQVKIIEAKLDKGKYAAADTINLNLTITSNTNLSGSLRTWIVDPSGTYTPAGESAVTLSSSEPLLFTDHYSLLTVSSGIHRLVYGIYVSGVRSEAGGDGEMLLSSGSEAFDVGDAVLLGAGTDKADYPTNSETPIARISMLGSVDANLEIQIDGAVVKTETVSLNGFTTMSYDLSAIAPGSHVLKAILTSGGLTSAKETSFVYGSRLPDMVLSVRSEAGSVKKDNTVEITATIMNQGKDPSAAATVAFYDGESLIENKPVSALNSGEYETVTISYNALGKGGEHTIKAVADPDNSVPEYNEQNNSGLTTVKIPDLIVSAETDKDIYKIRQKVYITTTITNLTSNKTYSDLVLTTTAKDPSGTTVYTRSAAIGGLGPSASTMSAEVWGTTGLTADGTHTITQTLTSGSQLIADGSKLIALDKAPDFTLAADTSSQRIKQGARATYTATLNPLSDWSHEVSLSIDGLPQGATATFTPDRLLIPGQSQTVVVTTDATTAGIHTLYLTAQGTDEGEIVAHTIPLTLDVSGYRLEATAEIQTVKQLETAVYPISLASLNGYEGSVSLNVTGLPFGTKASFDNAQPTVAGSASLTIITSKYAKPGVYPITITGDDGLARHALNLSLALQPNPDIAPGIIATPGPGPQNPATVRLYDPAGNMIREVTAFTNKYGATAITADINGDGYDEIIVSQGPDPKNTAALRALRRDGTPIIEYTAFDSKYGLTLAAGDMDGDWTDELIVGMGPDPKNPATFKILKYNGSGFDEVMSKTAYPDMKYGVNVTAGDVDGDNLPEIITAAGPGPYNPAQVKVWKYNATGLTEISTITAFEGGYSANIAAGDVNGDGVSEIIAGAGPDPASGVRSEAGGVRVYKVDGAMVKEIAPYDAKHGYGAYVATGDLDNDGKAEIITGAGPGPQNEARVKIFTCREQGAECVETTSFDAYPKSGYGVRVSGGRINNSSQ